MKRFRLMMLFALLAVTLAAGGCRGPLLDRWRAAPEPVVTPQPAWDEVFNRSTGWTGGDVAASFAIPGPRELWVFGDSWIGDVEDHRHVRATLVNNAIAVHPVNPDDPAAAPPPAAVTFLWGPVNEQGKPTAWITPRQAHEPSLAKFWYWPTGGGVVMKDDDDDQRLALFLILLTKTAGPDSVWSFQCAGSAAAVIDNVEDPPQAWTPRVIDLPHHLAADESGPEVDWGMAALAEDWVYVYGTEVRENNRRDLLIARVRPEDFDHFAKWDFRDGRGGWDPDPAHAAPILDNIASELSVDRVKGRFGCATYVMVYSEPLLGDRIFVRTARAPEGPWTEVQPVFTVDELQRSPNFFTYAAKGHLHLSAPGTLLISYIVNTHDFFELAADADIYRPRFFTLALPSVGVH